MLPYLLSLISTVKIKFQILLAFTERETDLTGMKQYSPKANVVFFEGRFDGGGLKVSRVSFLTSTHRQDVSGCTGNIVDKLEPSGGNKFLMKLKNAAHP